MRFPIMAEVNRATHAQLGAWIRFLSAHVTLEEEKIMDRIVYRFYYHFGGWSPEVNRAIGYSEPKE